ncbi:GNAT family N-acetyltransferase [Lachnospiraceae bacterium KK002]
MQSVGTCSFMISADKKIYDIAYYVHKNYWRQGYTTEIAQGMIDYARRQGAEKVTRDGCGYKRL